MIKIAFYDAKEYDKPSFERYGAAHEMQFRFLETRLISMPNVIATSHQAFLTKEALNKIAETTVRNILSYFRNGGICDNELCCRCGRIEQCKQDRKERCF